MLYIHKFSCISAQQTFGTVDYNILHEPSERKLLVIEPAYEGIPQGILRRMGKVVRIAVGAALPLIQEAPGINGIIIGTANGGKEDCVKFLNQIIEYDEGLLTPINFVQSTPNAAAAQIGFLTKNHGYNITHVHLGHAFEFALIDAEMMIHENPTNTYLVGSVDDISIYNYYFEDKAGWYKKEEISNKELYKDDTVGSIAGEAASMFLVNGFDKGSLAKLIAIQTLHNDDESMIMQNLKNFIKENLPESENIDLVITGENGDNRLLKFYTACENIMDNDITIARFKHMSGEFPSSTGIGLWLCCDIINTQTIPDHMIKKIGSKSKYKNVLLYNNYKGIQHSFLLVSA